MKAKDLLKEDSHFYLKQHMLLNGLSIKDMSEKTGYSYERVRQALKGDGSIKTIFVVCKALKINMKRLFKNTNI